MQSPDLRKSPWSCMAYHYGAHALFVVHVCLQSNGPRRRGPFSLAGEGCRTKWGMVLHGLAAWSCATRCHAQACRVPGADAMSNPRRTNGSARDKVRERWRARAEPCAICGKPIDYSLGMVIDTRTGKRRPHPMSFVVDEIVPVSLGGSPYSMTNTRPAHWICNARRGNGTRSKGPTRQALPLPWDL